MGKTALYQMDQHPLCIIVQYMRWNIQVIYRQRLRNCKRNRSVTAWCVKVKCMSSRVYACFLLLPSAEKCVCICVKKWLVQGLWGGEPGSWRSGHTRWICFVQRPSLEGKQRNGEFDRYFCRCVCECERVRTEPEKKDNVFICLHCLQGPMVSLTIKFLFNFLTPSA